MMSPAGQAGDDRLAHAQAAFAANRPQDAVAALADAPADLSASVEAMVLLARSHAWRGDFDQAEALFQEALRRNGADAALRVQTGFFYLEWHKSDQALAAFREAHALDPSSVGALGGLSFFSPAECGIDILADIDAALTAMDPQAPAAYSLRFSRARVLDKRGDFQQAWGELLEANRGYRQTLGLRMHAAGVYPKVLPPGWEGVLDMGLGAQNGPRLAIICGMPRAGKSTAESLLADLPQIKAGFETNLLRESVDDLNDAIGLDLVPGLHGLPAGYTSQLRDIFARKLADRAEGQPVYTLTVAAPYLMRGLPVLLRAWPKVRLILITRDPFDTALRIFQFLYQQEGHGYSYFLSGIMDQTRLWHDAVLHWAGAAPDRVMVLDYEDLIADPGTARDQMAAFIGLPEPTAPPPAVPDDRECAAPYRTWMEAALTNGD
jgi:tetratricopeptide (TPR) repeat protein